MAQAGGMAQDIPAAQAQPRHDHNLETRLANLPNMVMGVQSPEPTVQLESTTQFRKLLSIERNPPIQQVIDANVVPRFVEFLSRDDTPSLQVSLARQVQIKCYVPTSHHSRPVRSLKRPLSPSA